MLNWKIISLGDKDLFDKYIYNSPLSDFNFTNLYMWSHSRLIEYCLINNFLCIKTTYKGELPFCFLPFGNGNNKETISILIEEFKSQNINLRFRSLTKENKEEISTLWNIEWNLLRDKVDYIYSINELIKLEGRKFHAKKNHFNRFLIYYPHFTHHNITKDSAFIIKNIYKLWFEKMGNPPSLYNEFIAINSALDSIDILKFIGFYLMVDKNIIAFSLGERLNENTAVIHIEKADTTFEGAYQAINQQFLEKHFTSYQFVNREEDLGLEGLRKAKLSYNPIELLEKWEAKFI